MPTSDIDKGWAWVVLGVAFFNLCILGAMTVSIGIFQTEFLQHFDESTAYVSVAGSVCTALQMLLGPVSSLLCNWIGVRATMIVGVIFLSLGLLTSSFVSTLPQLIFCFGVVGGFGFGASYTPSAIVAGIYFKEKRVLTNGIALAATGTGMMTGPHLIGWLINQYGWRFSLTVFSWVVAQMVVSSSLVFPLRENTNQAERNFDTGEGQIDEPPLLEECANQVGQKLIKSNSNDNAFTSQDKNNHQQINGSKQSIYLPSCIENDVTVEENKLSTDEFKSINSITTEDYSSEIQELETETNDPFMVKNERKKPARLSVISCCRACARKSNLKIYRSKFLWLLALNFYLLALGYGVQIIHLPSYALQVGVNPPQIPTLFTAYGLTVTIARVLSGVAFNVLARYILIIYIVMVCLMGVVLTTMPFWAHGFLTLIIYQVLFAVTYGTSFVLISPLVVEMLGVWNLASGFGSVLFVGGLSYITGPPIAGALYDMTSSYSFGFHLGGLMSFLGGVVLIPVVFIQRGTKRKREEIME